MFGDFVWWQGVVEDRLDPLKLGRCRVRILGYHTDNKQDGIGIPTEHLPWATPSQPITSAAMNGIGTTPLGPVEGTWVFGFFRDGKNAQEPVMMSTFGGIPQKESDPRVGFNDPFGTYPLSSHIEEPDTNRLARGGGANPVPLKGDLLVASAEDSPSLDHKRKSRTKSVPIADAGNIRTTSPNTNDKHLYPAGSEDQGGGDDGITNPDIDSTKYTGAAKDTEKTLHFHRWNEPNPRYGGVKDSDTEYLDIIMEYPAGSGEPGLTSVYPHNHVRMSESGHVEEWDDTPNAERMHRYHTSGTFEEIQPDGTKVTKVVGNGYEITLGNKNVSITGTCNVTVNGDCRMLYKGNLVQEIEGDYHLNVHGDKRTKISQNEITEVLADRKVVVNGNCDLKVGKDQIINIDKDRTINITGSTAETITGDLTEITYGDMTTIVAKNKTAISVENMDITSIGDLGISTDSNCNITTTGNTVFKVFGTYGQQITGATRLQYKSTLDERHEGHYKIYTGDDTSSVRVSGKVDHSCPTVRTGTTACNTAQPVS
jgi:hypothetical protein